jgi:hypothetical protein
MPTVVAAKGALPKRYSNRRDEADTGKDRPPRSEEEGNGPDGDRADTETLAQLALGPRHQPR